MAGETVEPSVFHGISAEDGAGSAAEPAAALEEIVLRYSRRGMNLLRPYIDNQFIVRAAEKILEQPRGPVLIATGFYVNGAAETDGPPGAFCLARALKQLGYEPMVVTDCYAAGFFGPQAGALPSGAKLPVIEVPLDASGPWAEALLARLRPTALISVERCGVNLRNDYENMKGRSIRHVTAPIDRLFEAARQQGIFTVGIGDGGNEIGMGCLAEEIARLLPLCPCKTETDALIIATVSNWGAYGLSAALGQLTGMSLLPSARTLARYIEHIVALGSVDGVLGRPACSVDGFDLKTELEILSALAACAGQKTEIERRNNMSKYTQLRRQWPVFRYDCYEIEETEEAVKVRYHFQIPGLSAFAPEWTFPRTGSRAVTESLKDDPVFQNMVFSLGMAELVSYWKICCPPVVQVEAGCLNERQINWWKNLYYHGLGEFFYVNGILEEAEPQTFMEIVCPNPAAPSARTAGAAANGAGDATGGEAAGGAVAGAGAAAGAAEAVRLAPLSGCLIPIGGGKDSVVTIELVKKTGLPSMAYIINPRGATVSCARTGGYGNEDVIAASRTLDENMLRLNREGYLNGHTPFSAIVAFSSVIAAYMHRLKYVALSNESSANESTVPGSTVNHQYSKSFQFEADFHRYEEECFGSGIYYFSLLRPLSEFQIARYFARQKPYHGIFRSCNAGSKQDKWCGHCPKCLFVYLILSPFLSRQELVEIFGVDMLNDSSMLGCMEQLTGLQKEKPFECVGSRDEVNTAVTMTISRLQKQNQPLPVLLEAYRRSPLYGRYAGAEETYFTYYDKQNLLPAQFEAALKQECLQP